MKLPEILVRDFGDLETRDALVTVLGGFYPPAFGLEFDRCHITKGIPKYYKSLGLLQPGINPLQPYPGFGYVKNLAVDLGLGRIVNERVKIQFMPGQFPGVIGNYIVEKRM